MNDNDKPGGKKPDAGERQSDVTTEANKSDDARAKDKPKAGNILGGVQSK